MIKKNTVQKSDRKKISTKFEKQDSLDLRDLEHWNNISVIIFILYSVTVSFKISKIKSLYFKISKMVSKIGKTGMALLI